MTTAQQVIDIAQAQVGYQEGFSGGHWNNLEKYAAEVPGLEWANGQPWCDVFVAWCLLKAGVQNQPVSASCAASVAGWKARNRWSEYPAIGAQVMFGANGGGVHTGIVIAYDADTITTVEGNTNVTGSPEGDGVYLKSHQRRAAFVYGYGYPEYEEGIQSADPAWARVSGTAPGGIASGVVTPPPPPPPVVAKPAVPQVSLARLLDAIRRDGPARQGSVSHPDDVRPVEQALAQRGFLPAAYASDGSAGTSSFGPGSAYQRLQLAYGFRGTAHGQASDGYPGLQSLTRLGNETGRFTTTN